MSSAKAVQIERRTMTSSFKQASYNEDDVDTLLWKESGKIERNKDSKLCRHGSKAMCVHCTPLEPYDEAYMREHNIKHMSFHSYLRKMTGGVDK